MLLRRRRREVPTTGELLDRLIELEPDAALIGEERRDAARAACAHLSVKDQQLLAMLFADPPKPYKEISSVLGIPVGAIGPTRARCLTRARRSPAIAGLLASHGQQMDQAVA